jgi:hypothetical protein
VNRGILLALFQFACATGFSQSLSFPADFGDPFQCTNLEVRWEAPKNVLPQTVWIYRVLPKPFPQVAISNLVVECGLTGKDLVRSNMNGILYKSSGKHPDKQLGISPGSIFYVNVTHYGPTNLAVNVPEMSEIPGLATNFLERLGIHLSEIQKNADGAPKFQLIQPLKEYFLPGRIVTNVEFREVSFGRSVNGFKVLGTGGYGDIEFGEGKPIHIDISWQEFEQYKCHLVAQPETIIKWIREGKAVQQGIPMNLPAIDWPSVKSLTVKEVNLCYYAGERFAPSEWLMPLVSLWTTVDTGSGNIDVEIDCPALQSEPGP